MNNYEKKFIDKCILSSKKDRLSYELNTLKKRRTFVNRFCHESKKYIDHNCIIASMTIKELNSKTSIIDNEFYVLSDLYLNGIMLCYKDLISYINNEFWSIIAIGTTCAIVKEEGLKACTYLLKIE